MRLSKYYYNPKTCRYEPTRTSIPSIAGYTILFALSTAVIFVGILTIHSKFFLSERGKALKKENKALTKHYASLKDGLSSVHATLTSLNTENTELHKKIFETPLTISSQTHSDNSIQPADERGFKNVVSKLKNQSASIAQTSEKHNAHFRSMEVGKKDLGFLMSIPSIQPIDNPSLNMLVSGFGKRINPYHKGLYEHPGADFAATRGTSVMATAKGTVVDIQRGSSLQAGYGNYIEIDHGNGIITRYAHLEEVSVRIGQRVSKGSVIGTVGMSGGAVAPHVHYEIIRNGGQVDPVLYMMENLNSNQYAELQKLGRQKNQSLD
ncbi:MAG TPA: M23 family metallopeptidase [Cyclobacteriaceae bacterium]